LISSTPRPSRRLQRLFPPPAIASTSKEVVYETPTHRPFLEPEDDDEEEEDDDDDFAEENVQDFGREYLGPTASRYKVPDFYNRRFLDTNTVFEKSAIRL